MKNKALLIMFIIIQMMSRALGHTICLEEISINAGNPDTDDWDSDTNYNSDVYAQIYVNDNKLWQTVTGAGNDINYGPSLYCASVGDGDTYKVEIWDEDYLGPDDGLCWFSIICCSAWSGVRTESCQDSNGLDHTAKYNVHYITTTTTPAPTTTTTTPAPTTTTTTPAPTTTTTTTAACSDPNGYVGDGDCDSSYNTELCEWDGGDCCEQSCVSGNYYCTSFNCLDPEYKTSAQTTTTTTSDQAADDLTLCQFILDHYNVDNSIIGDGVCNTDKSYTYYLNGYGGSTSINDGTCQFDGGDCCIETNSRSLSTDASCKDPRYTPSPTTATYQACIRKVEINGVCDNEGYYAKITINGANEVVVEGNTCNWANNYQCRTLSIGDVVAITGYWDDNDVEICGDIQTVPDSLSPGSSIVYSFQCYDGSQLYIMDIYLDVTEASNFSDNNSGKLEIDSSVIIVIVVVVIFIIVICIAGLLWFLWKKKKTSNLDYQKMGHVLTTNTAL